MNFAERLERWNAWYDGSPEEWRFQMIVWPVVAIGAINMALTIGIGFPFGLLLLLAIVAVACVRVPFVLGWIKPAAVPVHAGSGRTRIEIGSMQWVGRANRWYDGLPELRRPWVVLAVLAVAGAINMVLTISYGFSFGLIFLLALLVLVAIRGPYAAGWLGAPPSRQDSLAVARPAEQIVHATPLVVRPAEEPLSVVHAPPSDPV